MSDQATDSLFQKMSRGEQVDTKEVFRYELYRLQSFVTWPRDTNAYPTNLARAGLYYLGNGDTVACFHCNVHLGQWEKIDLPLAEHERHSPNCAFIRGENIGNVPLVVKNQVFSVQLIRQQEDEIRNQRAAAQSIGLPTSPGVAVSVDSNLLDILQKQMAELSLKYPYSFAEKHTRQALHLASKGPDNTMDPQGLTVQGGNTRNMTETQLQTGLPTSGGESKSSETTAAGSTRQEQINQAIMSIATEPVRQGVTEYCAPDTLKSIMQSANHPAYAHINRRMESYANWPYSHVQNPIRLAEAGFYYTGKEDRIRCFLCNGGLCNWESEDVAWYEHCRWFERCRYAIACKAHPVIKAIVETAEQLRSLQSAGHHQTTEQTHCDEIPDGAATQASADSLASKLEGMGFTRDKIQTMLQARGTEETSVEQAVEILTTNLPRSNDESSSLMGNAAMPSPVSGATASISSIENLVEGEDLKDVEEAKDDDISGKKKKKKSKKKKGKRDASPPTPKDREPTVSASSLTEEEQEGSEAVVNKALTSLKTENEALKSRRICKVCMEKEVCIVFLPCSHLVCCMECAMQLSNCPMCRGTIKATVKVFI